jgi:hypothetical protein
MSLLFAVIIYSGGAVITSHILDEQLIQPYIVFQQKQDAKDFPVDQLGLKIEQENDAAFDNLGE